MDSTTKDALVASARLLERHVTFAKSNYTIGAQFLRDAVAVEGVPAEPKTSPLDALLPEILEFLEDQEDTVDGPDGEPKANRAMQLAGALRRFVE